MQLLQKMWWQGSVLQAANNRPLHKGQWSVDNEGPLALPNPSGHVPVGCCCRGVLLDAAAAVSWLFVVSAVELRLFISAANGQPDAAAAPRSACADAKGQPVMAGA